MPVETPSIFARVIQDHLELKERNAPLETLMPLGRYKVEDPPVRLFHKACGEEADPQLVCSHCAEPVAYGDLRAEYAPGAW